MKKISAILLIAMMFLALLPANNVHAASSELPKHVPGELLIKFADTVSDTQKEDIIKSHGAQTVGEISKIGVKILKVPEQGLSGIMQALKGVNGVEYVETDSIIEPALVPNDPYYGIQWHLAKIDASDAWTINTGTNGPVIAILDTGFFATHPDLSSKFVSGYNTYSNTFDWSPSSSCDHGDWVAGTAAAMTNNLYGVAGVGWANRIMPIKVTSDLCGATTTSIANGIIYAADHGAKVANVSFAIYAGDSTITSAAQYMYNHGGWVVAAGGNSGTFVSSPDNPYIISVGATIQDDTIAYFSSYGSYIDFAAPGVGIYTTCTCNVIGNYTSVSGTSFSSPIVAGVIALLFSQNPNATPQQVYNALKSSAVDLGTPGYDNYFGWGRIDAYRALQTISIGVDTAPPSVSISSPTTGSIISSTSPTITGTSSDPGSGIWSVTVTLDSISKTVTGTTSWSVTTSGLAQGSHTIVATAKDNAGNTASKTSTFTVDTISPSVLISSPTSGSTISTTSPVITGTSSDAGSGVKSVTVTLDGVLQTVTGTTSWSVATSGLAQGSHTIVATAKDNAGNTAPVASTFTVNAITPTVSITSPASGSTISSTSPTITGTASDNVAVASVTVTLDGISKTVTGTTSWSAPTSSLAQGSHTIVATAKNNAGNTASKTSTFTVDTAPPSVSISSPTTGSIISSTSPVITGTSSDPGSGIWSVTVTLDSISKTVTGTTSWSVTTSGLAQGSHTIVATAKDNAGNTASKTSTFTVDTISPSVLISSPTSGSTISTTSPVITGTSSDAGSGVKSVTVTLDGVLQTVTGTTSWSVTTSGLAQGSHTIVATAKDNAGNTAPVASTFKVNTIIVSITSPAPNSNVSGKVTISVSASNIFGISKVELYIDSQLTSTQSGSFNYTWNTNPVTIGPHTITAKAYDMNGNNASATETVSICKC